MSQVLEELCTRVKPHAREGEEVAPFPGVTVHYGRSKIKFHTVVEPMLCFVLRGKKRLLMAERTFDYAAPMVSVLSLQLPAQGQLLEASPDQPYLAVGLRLERSRLSELALDLPVPSHEPEPFAVATLDDGLLEPLLRLVRLFDAPEDAPVLAPMIEREILYRMLRGPSGPLLHDFARGTGPNAQIRRALAWICAHYDAPFHAKQLASMVGMSVTSLHRHFKALTGQSPLAYHKQIRLARARERLLLDPGSVARTAYAVGYESASQFSREYARQYGLPPGADQKRMRVSITS